MLNHANYVPTRLHTHAKTNDKMKTSTYTSHTMNNYRPSMSRKQRIYDALSLKLTFDSLQIDDESHGHKVPAGAETHFKVVAVSTMFKNLNRIERHRLINAVLAPEFTTGLHALSLHLYTPDEWSKKTTGVTASPLCHHSKN